MSTLTMAAGAELVIDHPGDTVAVAGSLTLDNARVVVADITQFDREQVYPLVACGGTVAGAFDKQVGEPHWVVTRRGGTVCLVYSSGTLFTLQ